jgi:hypothetical protein
MASEPETIPAVGSVNSFREDRWTVKPPDIIRAVGGVWQVTFLQGMAGVLTTIVLIVLGALLVIAILDWNANVPRAPAAVVVPQLAPIPPDADAEAIARIQATNQAIIADYKALTDAVNADHRARLGDFADNRLRLLDAVPTKIVYPLLTLLLGYLFGAQTARSNSSG